jgi:RNA polymerase sigma factor (sigma-70 family)
VSASDAELAARTVGGDRGAFGDLARRAAPAAHALLRRMGADATLADDIVQDALVAAYRSIASYRAESSFAGWLMKIAARLYFKRKRKDARLVIMAEPIDPEVRHPADPVGMGFELDRALAALSPGERVCVSLCHGAGFTQAEIAEALQVPLGTVKSHVTRGLEKLRRRLRPEETLGVACNG